MSQPSAGSPDTCKWGNASLIAQNIVESRVNAHNENLVKHGTKNHVPALVAIAMERLMDVGLTTSDIPTVILESYLWEWHMMPYVDLYHALLRLSLEVGGTYANWKDGHSCLFRESKIDEWIILNEKWLRGRDDSDWQYGMVTLDAADTVFPGSILTDSARVIFRPDPLPGYEILCDTREPRLRIQPSTAAFKRSFERFSDGVLKNLDWDNIVVAGGIVVGALLENQGVYHNHSGQYWAMSDIDIYLYGLSPSEANRKINHIFEVFRANLPPTMRILAVRNSKTITFYADYPLRRIQIVLKLAKTPRDVLLNFDLDICAMGWDGCNVWMLPRAARALETGCNTFTMNLIQGHYLSERRASQPQRIFKYADKGYGIRFLPSYIASLGQFTARENEMLPLDIAFLEAEARAWIENKLGPGAFGYSDLLELKTGNPSVLSGFTSLMRHVVLREMGQRLDISLEGENWASASYEDTYEIIPKLQYHWDDTFNHSRFRSHIIHSNMSDIDDWTRTDLRRLRRLGIECGDQLNRAQRMTFASNPKDLLMSANDIRMPLILPINFARYANELIAQAEADAGLPETKILEPVTEGLDLFGDSEEREGLFMWTIGTLLMWQQLDRRIDEVFEALYAFRRANHPINEDLQLQRFTAEMSRRNVSAEAQDEFDAFAKWIGRRPN